MSENVRIEMSREYRSLGFFQPEEVMNGYAAGRFMSGDYGRYEDSTEWRPVEAIISERGASPQALLSQVMKAETRREAAMSRFECSDEVGDVNGCSCGSTVSRGSGFMQFFRELISRF